MGNSPDEFRVSLSDLHYTPIDKYVARNAFMQTRIKNYATLYGNDFVQQYNEVVVAALLHILNHSEWDVIFRDKSLESLVTKVDECTGHAIFNPDTNTFSITGRPICDVFAMKFIIPNTFSRKFDSSKHQQTADSIALRKVFEKAKLQMSLFRLDLVDDETQDDISNGFKIDNYTVTKKQYIKKCIQLMNLIKFASPKEETKLHRVYNDRISTLNSYLDTLKKTESESELIDADFINQVPENFLSLYNKFESTLNNRIGMYFAANAIRKNIDKNEELLKTLGITISVTNKSKAPDPIKENGFETFYIYIDTLVGTIEIQVQSEGQYYEATKGNASHNGNYKITIFDEFSGQKSPSASKEQLTRYIPKKGSAELKGSTVTISNKSTRENFYSTFLDELPESSKQPNSYSASISDPDMDLAEKYRQNPNFYRFYLESFYTTACAQGLLPDDDASTKSYTIQDIWNYIHSPDFAKVQVISNLWEIIKEKPSQTFYTLLSQVLPEKTPPRHMAHTSI